ncbi:MAG: alpha/beta hydrolase, partial [Nocardioides sp.]|nr:alpha/beta hydrolase [Nocardioides sp.]
MKRLAAIVAVIALVGVAVLSGALVLMDAGDRDARDRTPRANTPGGPEVTAPPTPDLDTFYSQRIDWQPCSHSASRDCATLEVPVDYRDPGGETFALNLLRVPAAGRPIGSLVVNPGGPGAPGTSYANMAPYVFGEPLLKRFDIIGFDPRGTGESSPVDCLSD